MPSKVNFFVRVRDVVLFLYVTVMNCVVMF